MAIEREPNQRFQIYEDSSAPAVENATEETPGEAQPNKSRRGSSHRLPSINPEDHIMERDEHFNIEEAAEDRGGAYSSSDHHSSDEAVFEDEQNHSSPTTSHSDSISEFPDETPVYEGTHQHLPYTPVKQRSPFRNPSSVRAMQMDVTPPFNHSAYMTSPLSGRHKLSTPSRNGTPRSTRSESVKKKTSPKKEYPLVLLHVTLLPITFPYSLELMMSVLPPYIVENYNLLKDKATETVLERGILVPHPREDYELLEERLLESLELKVPRILQCGHFHLDEEDYDTSDDPYASEDEDADICDDCGRRIRDGRMGSGTGHKRWSIKIYAANGLMRAGAWAAAWREMERVDVEIEPWIPEDLRRELDMRRLEQEEAEEERQREAEEEERRETEEERGGVMGDAEQQTNGEPRAATPYQESTRPTSPQERAFPEPPQRPQDPPPHQQFIKPQPPLLHLLHLLLHTLQTTDKRNLAIILLSFLVLVLSLNPAAKRPAVQMEPYDILMAVDRPLPQAQAQARVSSGVVSCVSSEGLGVGVDVLACLTREVDVDVVAEVEKRCADRDGRVGVSVGGMLDRNRPSPEDVQGEGGVA
ncbi:MAG: hypothetical protein M1839_004247 [Geoglossum umbratile]|nr:MAG: hypothetical protein M1839_004247 [Geoglossum umbratile]